MSYYPYHWCVVPGCENTSIKTPKKLWIQAPTDVTMRNTWLKLAKRNPSLLSEKSRLYFCEDHFDLEHDMENYMQYKLMGSVKKIRMKPQCIPTRFDCQAGRKHQLTSNEPHLAKRKRIFTDEDNEEDFVQKDFQTAADVSYLNNQFDKAVQTLQVQEHKSTQAVQIKEHKSTQVVQIKQYKSIQVCSKAQYRSKHIQAGIKSKDKITSPLKFSISTGTLPLKISMISTINPSTSQSNVRRKLSCAPSLAGSTVDQESSPYKLSSLSKTASDSSSQEEYKKVEKINLHRTLLKIKNKPKLYIGLQKNIYFLVDLIKKHTGISEENILLCFMKIKLNWTYSELADDFDLSVTQASNIFLSKMPGIVKVLSPFIKSFSINSIKENLPIAFRHKYNRVTCIIDCLEIEIQKPTNPSIKH